MVRENFVVENFNIIKIRIKYNMFGRVIASVFITHANIQIKKKKNTGA